MAANRCDFNIDFASPAEWATMYRSLGIQIVPAWLTVRDRQLEATQAPAMGRVS